MGGLYVQRMLVAIEFTETATEFTETATMEIWDCGYGSKRSL